MGKRAGEAGTDKGRKAQKSGGKAEGAGADRVRRAFRRLQEEVGEDLDAADEPATPRQLSVRETGLQPHFGKIRWRLPPSYRAFLELANRLGCLVEDDSDDCAERGFEVFDQDALIENNEDLVHLPEGVSRDDTTVLTTNHLVGFAGAGLEAIWCFDVTSANAEDEYPVYYHHQEEPRARILASGAWENLDDARPDFACFADWFEAMVEAYLSPKKPQWWDRLGEPTLVALSRSEQIFAQGEGASRR